MSQADSELDLDSSLDLIQVRGPMVDLDFNNTSLSDSRGDLRHEPRLVCHSLDSTS